MSVERLAFGAVLTAGAPVAIWTAPLHTRAILASLVMTNTGNDDVEVTVAVTAGGRSFRVLPPGLVIQGGDSFHLITPISIEMNESITITASLAGTVEYYLTAAKVPGVPSPSERAA